ncbi:MAG: hypothetical protein LBV18_02315 [Alistipes sp.]|jgi:AraC-like DNA-binding protein|nr:hypothetical protein [Alistipes sp.]
MNDFADYIKILIFVVPAFCSVLCSVTSLFWTINRRNVVEKKFRFIAATWFLATAVWWFALFFRIFTDGAAMRPEVLLPLSLSYLYIPVLFYHMVHYLTHIGCEKPGMSVLHYILPLPVALAIVAIAIHVDPSGGAVGALQATAEELQAATAAIQSAASTLTTPATESTYSATAFARTFLTYPALRLSGALYYSVPSAILIVRAIVRIASRQLAKESVPALLRSLAFTNVFTLLTAAILPAAMLSAIIDSRNGLNVPALNIITAILMTAANISLMCHIIKGRYDQFEIINIAPRQGAIPPNGNENGGNNGNVGGNWNVGGSAKSRTAARAQSKRSSQPSRKAIEEYFHSHKPFLDPEFGLDDLADALNIKRSVMSSFINSAFKMNFKRYVNRWRLHEYHRLLALPSNEKRNPYKILPQAGFTDPRHYRRVLQLEEQYEQAAKKASRKKAVKAKAEAEAALLAAAVAEAKAAIASKTAELETETASKTESGIGTATATETASKTGSGIGTATATGLNAEVDTEAAKVRVEA